MIPTLPIAVFAACPSDVQAAEMEAYKAGLDREAAALLRGLAKHHRRDWDNAAFGRHARRTMLLVAQHIEDRSRG